MSSDDFDTEGFASGGERPPITGGSWRAEGRNGFYAGDFIRGMVAAAGLWDHDPTRRVPLVDRRGPEPVKLGDGVIVRDEEGNAVFEGTVDRPLFDRWQDYGHHFSIRPTTKEQTNMHTLITVNAVGPTDDAPPSVSIEVDYEGPSVDHLERAISQGELAGRGLLAGMGIAPYSEVTIEVAKPDPMNDAIARDRELLGRPAGQGDAPKEEQAVESPSPDVEATNRRMYNAIGTAAENLTDIAKELADGAEGDEGSEGFRERLGVLAKTLAGTADALGQARLPEDIPF